MRIEPFPRRTILLLLSVVALALAATGSAKAATVQAIPINTTNWSGNAGYGSTAPGWYEDSFGLVHLQGAAKRISTTTPNEQIIGTLPPAARPNRDVFTVAHTFNGTYADVVVEPNGVIFVQGAAYPALNDPSFVSLEGITYQPANAMPATALSLDGAGWSGQTGYGPGVGAPAAYTDGSGLVHLQGAVRQISMTDGNPSLVGWVPSGDAPGYDVYFIVATNDGTYADLVVTANGAIEMIAPRLPMTQDYSFVSLEGISYGKSYVTGSSIALNTANWSGNAGYQSRSPQVYEDNASIIHLEGAVLQTSGGTDANLIGVLPQWALPHRTVYTIVHTFSGTYADLAIQPNGQVWVIDPRSPAVQDLRFLSLEGITYQQ
jgi:hypothetical protein